MLAWKGEGIGSAFPGFCCFFTGDGTTRELLHVLYGLYTLQ